jgi:tyrosyl-tRNA synthetase
MKLSEELRWRGFINQTTLEDLARLDEQTWTFYHGFDASADSQAIGNLAAMMLDRAFMRHGHKAIILAGGATSLIGDPGGKDKERPLQDEATIARNVAKARQELENIFSGYDFTLVNNLDWTKDLGIIKFLRDIGKHFSMTALTQRDYIATRMGEGGSGLSYAEFSYTLLQGMDFLQLFDDYNCTLQLSGSDQWGNCLSGIDLIRKARGAEAHAITMPLIINKATGKKFGKSEEGAIWLDSGKTSVYRFYQFWLNMDDDGVEDYLKIYTELGKPEVESIMAEFKKNPAGRFAQKTLAYEVTKLVHGKNRAEDQKKIAAELFGKTRDFHSFTTDDFSMLESELPFALVHEGDSYLDALINTGLAASKTEARRLIEDGAISANKFYEITSSEQRISAQDFLSGYMVLFKGKKHIGLLKIQ